MKLEERTIAERYVYQGKILKMRVDTVELPNGKVGTREVVEYSGAVAVVPLTVDDKVLLVRQYRYPVSRALLEIPAGKLEAHEDPRQAAARELEEETGHIAGRMEKLLQFFSTPGFTSEEMHLYLARDLSTTVACPDEDEFVEVVPVPMADALAMIGRGEICDAKSIVGLLAAEKFLRNHPHRQDAKAKPNI